MSYALFGYKWGSPDAGSPSGEILWTVSDWTGLLYDTSLYSQDDFESALQSAFDRWEAVSGLDFTYTASASSAAMDFSIEPLPPDEDGDPIGLGGFWGYGTSGDFDTITEGFVILDEDETWAPFGETDLNFYAVALHEIGHAIGLDHVTDPGELMYGFLLHDDLQAGDIAGAQAMYGTDDDERATTSKVDVAAMDEGGGGGGGGGGIGAILLGLILGLVGLLTGGMGAGAVAFAAAQQASDRDDDDDRPDSAEHGPDLFDVIPATGVLSEEFFHADALYAAEPEDDGLALMV